MRTPLAAAQLVPKPQQERWPEKIQHTCVSAMNILGSVYGCRASSITHLRLGQKRQMALRKA